MSAKDHDAGHHPVLRPQQGGGKKEDVAIRKALIACASRFIADLEPEIARLSALHDVARAEIVRLEALRESSREALLAAQEAHSALRYASTMWAALPEALDQAIVALAACRTIAGDAPPPEIEVP